jgi:hypothetical protein
VATLPFNVKAGNQINRTGTFSDFSYNSESGDLGGVEIRVVYARGGYQATIQFAEGEPSKLVLVDVQFKENNLSFKISKSTYEGYFEGKIEKNRLKGKFKFKGGGEWIVDIPRKTSYWD